MTDEEKAQIAEMELERDWANRKLDSERARSAKLIEALKHYAKLQDWPMLPVVAQKALGEYEASK